ncbi:ferritin-like domain-containing protein [Lentinula aciculospora]|uniref:Ferritin-like domain-containing protein n=1 Tax=Lentinula aciculospora TaxID=153920 RepID=A0A9W9A233_9AGAR|nr:ferritin-like domain-containing protein [Lentinula aciculospora]
MRFSTYLLAAAVPLAANAAPLRATKRQAAAIDVTVLQFANTLEQLESQFYAAGLSKFQDSDFSAAGFAASSIAIQQITNIQSDEATHASILEEELTALGQNPNSTCSFNFDSALTDVSTMAATARVVENLGVMAYLGAASLLTDPQLLEAAGSILTVEARHQTILNVLSGTGTAIPSAFDLALTPSEVLAVAAPFFSGTCDLGIPANPTLTVTNTGSVGQGTSLTFSSTAINSSVDTSTLFCQMMVGGNPFSISLPYNQCVVPSTINGPVAIYITSDDNPLQSNVVNRASANNILAGPTVAFIDAQPETLGQMVRSSGTGTASASSSTQTISPDVAASIVSAQGASTVSGAAATATSATDSAAAATSTSNSVNDSSDPSAPFRDDFTGLAPGGAINVIGWSNIPSN